MDFTVHPAGTRPQLPQKRSKALSKPNKFSLRTILPAAACVATLSMASASVEAVAQESPLTAIISEISQHEADINRINLEIGNLREAVNQALVDLHDAQSLAEQARRGAHEARQRLDETQAEVEKAQDELDQLSRSAYRATGANGSPVHAGADARKDSLDRQTYLRKESEEKQRAIEDLQRVRTAAANNESTLRQASRLADDRATAAEEAETRARATLESSVTSLETQLAQRDAVSAELSQAQNELVEHRPEAASALGNETQSQPSPAGEQAEASVSTDSTNSKDADAARNGALDAGQDAQTNSSSESASPASTEASEAHGGEPSASSPDSTPESSTEASESAAAKIGETTTSKGAEEHGAAVDSDVTPDSGDTKDRDNGEDGTPGAPTPPSLEDFSNPDTVQAALDAFAEAVGQTQAEHTSFDSPYTESAATEENDDSTSGSESEGIAAPSSSDSADDAVTETDEEQGTNVAGVLPEVEDAKQVTDSLRGSDTASDGNREQQIEAVIARAESQIGTPYVWGGGDANGATMGLDGKGYNGKAGYDCSGLVLYAYSGAGVSLPHYTGYQYQRGTQIPVDEAERGDLLFWGDGGSQHVAIYLGDGMMLEAPQTGMNVQKTAVRRNGLAPMAVRLI
ncbi:NlpC/P60 family protein [Corynebacterium sp. P3-F1]|uniref:DIP1281 family NlpC/P60 protein n=1 Tax=Corynebacterium sp. P3-F1 TaxID=3059080 RepID=UPI00265D0ED7|nr:NlpC/P60 family protein [Corynebacterium sp. P3-F1]WKK61562.1 NlpC/P60 family protein [Corynebacterium sp. P3-F1]